MQTQNISTVSKGIYTSCFFCGVVIKVPTTDGVTACPACYDDSIGSMVRAWQEQEALWDKALKSGGTAPCYECEEPMLALDGAKRFHDSCLEILRKECYPEFDIKAATDMNIALRTDRYILGEIVKWNTMYSRYVVTTPSCRLKAGKPLGIEYSGDRGTALFQAVLCLHRQHEISPKLTFNLVEVHHENGIRHEVVITTLKGDEVILNTDAPATRKAPKPVKPQNRLLKPVK